MVYHIKKHQFYGVKSPKPQRGVNRHLQAKSLNTVKVVSFKAANRISTDISDDHDHVPFMGSLSSIGLDLIRSTDIPNLKHLAPPVSKTYMRGDAKSIKLGGFEVVMDTQGLCR